MDLRPRIISDEESPYAEDVMGPPANLQLETGRSSREPLVDYQHWIKIGCCRLGSQSPCQGAQGPGLLRLPLPHENRRLPMGICSRRDYFPVQAATDTKPCTQWYKNHVQRVMV